MARKPLKMAETVLMETMSYGKGFGYHALHGVSYKKLDENFSLVYLTGPCVVITNHQSDLPSWKHLSYMLRSVEVNTVA